MPHLIVLMADQLRYDFIGSPFTPNINQLLGESTVFNRQDIFIQFDGNGARGPHKLIVDLFKDETYFELYHVDEDPQEKHNRAFDQPDIVRPMFDTLTHMMRDLNDLITIAPNAYDAFLSDYMRYRNPEPQYLHT